MNTRPVITALVVCLALAVSGFAKTAPKKVVRKAPVKTSAKSSTTKRYAANTHTRRSTPFQNSRYATRRYAAPAAPQSDRISLVQQALIERGHLSGEPTGRWDAASIEALKKFETTQNVKADGKLDSKMLILLGLGPRYDANLALPGSPVAEASVAADDNRLNNN